MPKKNEFHYLKDQQVFDAAALLGVTIFDGGVVAFLAVIITIFMVVLGA